MRLLPIACGAATVLTLLPHPLPGAPPLPTDTLQALRTDVSRLASDEMEGRRVGTPGLERAAAYLERRMREIGLQPAGEEGAFRQAFQVTVGTELGSGNEASVQVGEAAAAPLRLEVDYLPLSFSGSAAVTDAEVVFAGYGIEAPELGYDDYGDVPVQGKVVLVLRDEPQEDEPESVFGGDLPSQYSDMRFKAVTAREKGAAGMIFLTGPLAHPDETEELVPLRNDYSGTDHGLPAVSMRLAAARPWLEAAGIDLLAWQQGVDHTLNPQGAALPGVRITLRTDLRKTYASTWNLVGRIPGSGHGGTVVLGAHFDHLGIGGPESLAPDRYGEIHNGADDNASGTAALLAVAAELRRRPQPLQRTVLVVAFSGEEEGLLGSSHFVRHPPVPLDEVRFMLNMDMVGRLKDDRLVVSGVGTGEGLEELLAAEAADLGLTIAPDRSGFGASDQTVFYSRSIPVLFFFTGAHSEYHKPEDDADLIRYEGLARVAALAGRVVARVADMAAGPEYRKVKVDTPAAGTGRGYGPYFGTIPDFGEPPAPGVLLSGVREGSPADKAGVRGGDLVVEFAGVQVRNLEEYTYALRKHRPGDEVTVVVVREGQRLTVKAVLEKRR